MDLLEISTYAWQIPPNEAIYKFKRTVVEKFGVEYLRGPNEEEPTRIIDIK
jgi:hypothetical protein